MADYNEIEQEIMKQVAARVVRSESRITAALATVTKDLDDMRARVDGTHSAVTQLHHAEDAMRAKNSAMQLEIFEMRKAMSKLQEELHEMKPWTMQMLQQRDESLDIRIATIVEHDLSTAGFAWKENHDDLYTAMKSMKANISMLNSDVDSGKRAAETAVDLEERLNLLEANIESSRSKSLDDSALNELNNRVDLLSEDIASTQEVIISCQINSEALEAVENSVGGCFDEMSGLRSVVNQRIADIEKRLQSGRSKMLEALMEMGGPQETAGSGRISNSSTFAAAQNEVVHNDQEYFVSPLSTSKTKGRGDRLDLDSNLENQENRPPLQPKQLLPHETAVAE